MPVFGTERNHRGEYGLDVRRAEGVQPETSQPARLGQRRQSGVRRPRRFIARDNEQHATGEAQCHRRHETLRRIVCVIRVIEEHEDRPLLGDRGERLRHRVA